MKKMNDVAKLRDTQNHAVAFCAEMNALAARDDNPDNEDPVADHLFYLKHDEQDFDGYNPKLTIEEFRRALEYSDEDAEYASNMGFICSKTVIR